MMYYKFDLFSLYKYSYSHWMKVDKPSKNAISNALREASKQRLQNALNQAQQRLGNIKYARNFVCSGIRIEALSRNMQSTLSSREIYNFYLAIDGREMIIDNGALQ